MKKVLIFSNSLASGGGEKIACDMANELSKNSDVKIFFLTIEPEVEYSLSKNVKNINCFKCKNKIINNIFSFFNLIKTINQENIDVVISHLFRANYINIICSKLIKYRCVIVTHGSILKYYDKKISSKINLLLIRKLFKLADEKIFLTERMLSDYINVVGHNNNLVIPNGYDLPLIINLAKSPCHIPFNNKDYYIFVGRFHAIKNIKFILDNFGLNGKNILLIGDGDNQVKLKTDFECENIIFLGRIDNPYPYIKNAKAIILASYSEGFPNVLIEALSLGVPVISSDCRTGPREILDIPIDTKLDNNNIIHNQYGALFNINDSIGFTLAINYIENNNFIYYDLIERANCFSLNKVSNIYIKEVIN